jgi:putative protease
MTPSGNQSFTLTKMQNLKGVPVEDAKGSGHKVAIELDTSVDLSFGIIMRYLTEGGTTRHPFAQNQEK